MVIAQAGFAVAQDSTWTNPVGGLWSMSANWSAGVPNGTGHTATFTTHPAGGVVLIDVPVTLGHIAFQQPASLTLLSDEVVTFDALAGNPARITLPTGAAALAIDAPIANGPDDDLQIDAADGGAVDLRGSLGQATLDLIKMGEGRLLLTGENRDWVGSLDLQSGVVEVHQSTALGSGLGETNIGPSGRLVAIGPLQLAEEPLHLNGGVLQVDSTATVTVGGLLDVSADSELVISQPSGRLRLTGQLLGSGELNLGQGHFEFAGQSQHDGIVRVSGGKLTVTNPLGSTLQVDAGLAEIRAASSSSGEIQLSGGTVTLQHGSNTIYGGQILLHDGRLLSSATSDIAINGLTAGLGNHMVSVPSGRALSVRGGVDGPGSLTLEQNGTISFTTLPLQQAGDLVLNGQGMAFISVPLKMGGRARLNAGTLRVLSTGTSAIEQKPGTSLYFDNGAQAYTGPIVVEGPSRIATGHVGTISGPISILSGTVEMQSLESDLIVAGPITGDGSLTLKTSGLDSRVSVTGPIDIAGNLQLVNGDSLREVELGNVTAGGNLEISNVSSAINGRLNVGGNLTVTGYRTTTLAGLDNVVAGHVEATTQGGLIVNGNTTFGSLLVGGESWYFGIFGGTGNVTVQDHVDLQRGTIEFTTGSLVGSPTIVKTSRETGRLKNVGALFTGNVQVTEGVLELTGAGALGAGSATLVGPDAAISINGEEPVGGTIFLNNHHGYEGRGALRLEGHGEFSGDLHLGADGATIAGSGMLVVSGSIHGGDLAVKSEHTPFGNALLWLRSDQHTYSGSTTVGAIDLADATLQLSHSGSLHSTRDIELGPTSSLALRNYREWRSSNDRLGDNIPIRMHGGRIILESDDATGEALGPLILEPGAARLLLDGYQAIFSVASLTSDPFASLEIRSSRLGGAGDRNVRLMVRDAAASDFLGGHITVLEDAATSSFLKYDAELGMLSLTSADYAPQNPSTWNASSHVLINGNFQLPSDRTIESLTMRQTDFSTDPSLDLQSRTLNVRSGGVVFPVGTVSVMDGRLTAGDVAADMPLYLHTYSSHALVDANISDNPGPDGQYDALLGGPLDADNGQVHLVKSGEGTLVLSGSNSYSGRTWVNAGTVEVLTSQAIPSTTDLVINGGRLAVMDNVVISPASVTVRYGTIVHSGGAIQSPLVVLENGFTDVAFRGDGEIIKSTSSPFELGRMSEFDGNIRVEAGTLRASGLGNGVTAVYPAARLEASHTLQGNVELRGGTLLASGSLNTIVQSAQGDQNGWVRVVENSFVEAENIITFRSQLMLDPSTTLTRQGSGEIVIASPSVFGDQSTLNLGNGQSQIGSESEPIYVGAAVTMIAQSGDIWLSGALTTTHADSSLAIDGAATYDVQSSVDVRAGQHLTVTRDGAVLPLVVQGQNRFVRGHGTLRNPLTLGGGGMLSPGEGVGRLAIDGPLVIESGASLRWEMRDASAVAGEGEGWDLLEVGQMLRFASAERGAYTMQIVGIDDDGREAAPADFDPTRSQQWRLATAMRLENFDPRSVDLSTAGFDSQHPFPRTARFLLSAADEQIWLTYDVVFGDFTRNRRVDARDIDELSNQIRRGSNDLSLDVNYDSVLDQADRAYWVQQIVGTWFGDANLDGVFNSADLVAVLARGEYEDLIARNSGWSEGDWNGDGEFTSGDLVVALADGGYETGPRVAVAVPEPASVLSLLVGVMAVGLRLDRMAKPSDVR